MVYGRVPKGENTGPDASCLGTLFGPYAAARPGPPDTGPSRKIKSLDALACLGRLIIQLEVLAGAIPWGFKSPSPHHFQQFTGHCVRPKPDPSFVARRPQVGPGR